MAFTDPAARPQSPVIAPRGATRVLILDDERFDRHRLTRLCSGLDFTCEVQTATTLLEFERSISKHQFDLILIDYRLPDGTGMDALDLVHCSRLNLNAATIMITGQGPAELEERAFSIGCGDYISKDALTATRFAHAVARALYQPNLTIKADAQTFARSEVARLLAENTAASARDMKPMISRLMRLARDLRAQANAEQTQGRTAGIEDSCVSIWEFLIALERQDGESLLAERLMQTHSSTRSQQRTARQKPPSPFSRRPN